MDHARPRRAPPGGRHRGRRHLGGHRRRRGRVHAGARRPARAGRADRRGRPGPRRARAQRRGRGARFPGVELETRRADLRPRSTCRRSTGSSPRTASTSSRAIGRSRSCGGWRRTCGRAGRSSSSSTTPTAAIPGSRTRSVPRPGSGWPPRPGWSTRGGSDGSRAGSSARSTPRSVAVRAQATGAVLRGQDRRQPVEVGRFVVGAAEIRSRTDRGGSSVRARAARTGHRATGASMPSSYRYRIRGPRPRRRWPSPGTGIAAIEPSISSGAGAATPSARTIRSRPSSTSSWFAAMSAGQPPGRRASQSMAAGSVR